MTRLLMTTDAVGGVWQYSLELARALQPLGVETVLAVMGPSSSSSFRAGGTACVRPTKGGGDGPMIIDTGLPLDWLAPDAATVAVAGDAVAALASDVGADVIHLNSPALAGRGRFPAPVVAVAHGCVGTWWQAARGTAPDAAFAWHGELVAAGLAAAAAAVAPSAAFAATLQRTYALTAPPLVVHNGRSPLPLPDAAPTDVVFTAGRLWDEVKNTGLLDRTAASLGVPFRAAGPLIGPHGERVEVAHLDHLGTLGDDALAVELAGTPIYVSAASFEPFGLSVLEAAAASCPLVLADIATFRELWSGAALFVATQEPDAYAAAIQRLRGDPALRAQLGAAARLRATRYTPAAMAAAMASIYAGVHSKPERVAA